MKNLKTVRPILLVEPSEVAQKIKIGIILQALQHLSGWAGVMTVLLVAEEVVTDRKRELDAHPGFINNY